MKRKKRYKYQLNISCDGELLDAIDSYLDGNPLGITRTQLVKAAIKEYIERNPTVAGAIRDSYKQ